MNKTVLKLIDYYQEEISAKSEPRCRHTPTCSNYAKEAYENYNFFSASFLTVKRILTCNPLFKSSYDPVPVKRVKKND